MYKPSPAFLSFVSIVSFVFLQRPAYAQTADQIGIRAQGMGGAFTAVADDSTATWWNPAGLAAGAYFNAIIELTRFDAPESGGDRESTRGFSVAYPALGLSYYRLRVSQIQPSSTTGDGGAGRQDQVALNQFAATVGQSVGNHLVVASTLKLVRAVGETHPGIDIGAMAKAGAARAGIMVRNAKVPQFNEIAGIDLARQVRVGAAVTSGGGRATVAADADLTTIRSAAGDDRRFAVGTELWTTGRSIGLRAGVSRNMVGDERTAVSGGVSLSVRNGTFIDVMRTVGSDATRRAWGFALRVTF